MQWSNDEVPELRSLGFNSQKFWFSHTVGMTGWTTDGSTSSTYAHLDLTWASDDQTDACAFKNAKKHEVMPDTKGGQKV